MLDIISNPPIQFFLLAVFAGLLRSDLEIPEQVTKAMSMYLMIAIGLKGGIALKAAPLDSLANIWVIFVMAVLLSFLLPFIGYGILRQITKLSRLDSAAVAAHYGSVSVVTFSFAVNFLEGKGLDYQGYIVTLMALMEAPAILSAILLARDAGDDKVRHENHNSNLNNLNNSNSYNINSNDGANETLHKNASQNKTHILRDALFNSSVVLLVGSMVIGFCSDEAKMQPIAPYLIKPFYAVLCVFLLELGLISAKQLHNLRSFPKGLVLFALIMPLIGASIACGIAQAVGLGFAEAFLFTVLGASASYIAVPAAMKLALPNANAVYYVTSSLVITFPFNLIIGVPLYYNLVKSLF